MLPIRLLVLPLLALSLAAQSAAELRLRRDVAWLADPARKGRGDGEPGLEEAAAFLVRRYKALGLPARIQRFPFLAHISYEVSQAHLGFGDQSYEPLVWGRDVEALGASGDGKFQHKALVFVGYGLEGSVHNDFQEVAVRDRVVMLVRSIPNRAPFDQLPAAERRLTNRLKRLAQGGAAAIVVLEEGDQPKPLRLDEEGTGLGVPVLSMPVAVPARVCSDLPERVKRLGATGEAQSKDYVYAPWSFLNLRLTLKREEVQLPNVIATVPGTARAKRAEHVVLGAHFDHLGLGERHSLGGAAARGSVHPGADDNASGTALVLELARRFKAHPARRSVTFIHFSGEEEGLLGSARFVSQPTIPLPAIKAMLNFDMVGRMEAAHPTLFLGGLGMPPAGMEAVKGRLPKGITVGQDLGPLAGASDHLSFAMAKIPTLFFFTGLHEDYHRPTDRAERILTKGMVRIADFAYQVTVDLANSEKPPAFDPATALLPSASRGVSSKVRFGTLPDYQPHKEGFRINGVAPGTTAEQIGLQAGDILTAFGNTEVHSIQDFMDALSGHQPGDKVLVKWLRDGKPREAEAQLRSRE